MDKGKKSGKIPNLKCANMFALFEWFGMYFRKL
jgi:hypothetical protein